jgi:DNA replication protein DnaC
MEARRQAGNVAALFGASQIPHQARDWTFATFPQDADAKALEQVKTYVRDLLADVDTTRRGLWLGGKLGRGKTGLAVSAMKEIMKHERSTLFVLTIELLNKLRASYGKETEITEDALLKAVTETEFVVLDDVATERPSAYVLEQLYFIIEKRRSRGLYTVFTSNLSTDDLAEYWRPDGVMAGAFYPGLRVVERIREYCIGCAVSGRNQRS